MKRFAYARISQSGAPEIRIIEADDVLDASRKAVISEYAETISQDTSAVSMGCSALTTPKQIVDYLLLWSQRISVPVEVLRMMHTDLAMSDDSAMTSLFGDLSDKMTFEYMVNELDYNCESMSPMEIDHIKQITTFVMLDQDKLPAEISMTKDQLLAKYPLRDTTPLIVSSAFRRKATNARKMDVKQFLGEAEPINEARFDECTASLGLPTAGEFLADLYGRFCGVSPEVLLKAFFTCICSVRLFDQINGYSDFGDAVWMIARHKHE